MKMRQKNIDRASAAEDGLEAWLASKGEDGDGDAQSNLGDFLADLRHMAQRQGIDFNAANLMGEIHFNEEGGKS